MWIWIILAGIAVRAMLLLIVDPGVAVLGGDSAIYLRQGLDGFRPPMYSIFLLATYPLGWWVPMALQSALTIGSGVAAERAFGGRTGAVIGLLIATCPFFAFFDFRLLSESLYINLLWLGWLLLFRGRAIASGFVLGLAILTRDTLLLLPLFCVLVALLTLKGAKTASGFIPLKSAMTVAAVAYLTITPWVAYNDGVSSGRLGLNLWVGTWERNDDWYLQGLDRPDFPAYAFASAQEEKLVRANWQNDSVLKELALTRLRSEPLSAIKAWVERYPTLWLGTRSDQITFRSQSGSPLWTVLKAGFYGLNLLYLILGLWGLLRPHLLFAVPAVYAALLYVPFHAESRYTLFAYPFLFALAGLRFLSGPSSRLVERKRREQTVQQG